MPFLFFFKVIVKSVLSVTYTVKQCVIFLYCFFCIFLSR